MNQKIKELADSFFEWPTENKSFVTLTSAILFAEKIAELKQEEIDIEETEMTENKMWAVQVDGPDDLYACPDREVAAALALLLNRQFERDTDPNHPPLKADVGDWPYDYETWKAESAQLRFEAMKA